MNLEIKSFGNTMKLESASPIDNLKLNLHESTLHFISRPCAHMKIFIKTEAGNTFPFEVDSSDTIGNLKAKIHKMQGTLPGKQRLFFNEKEVEDGGTLGDYNIQNESTLMLSSAGTKMTVKNLSVKPSDTANGVKKRYKLRWALGILVFVLVGAGVDMCERHGRC